METIPARHFAPLHPDLRVEREELGVLPVPSGRLAVLAGFLGPGDSDVVEVPVAQGDHPVVVLSTADPDEGLRQWHVGLVFSDRPVVRAEYVANGDEPRFFNYASTDVLLIDETARTRLVGRADLDEQTVPFDDLAYGAHETGWIGAMVSTVDGTVTAAYSPADDTTVYAVIVAYDADGELVWAGAEVFSPWHAEDLEREPVLRD